MIVNPYKFPTLKFFGNTIENVSPHLYEHLLSKHTSIKDTIYKNIMTRYVKTCSLFEEVSIETINRCNGSCSFCPVNKNLDTREFRLMEKELFYSIIDQLYDIKYNKVISLHCNNEPFLDKRIFEFAEYTHNLLSQATINLCTNGSLLTPKNFLKIIPNLSLLIVDNYNDKLKLNENIKPIHEICKTNKTYNDKVWIVLRKQNEILTSRSGQAKNRKPVKPLHSPCIYPFMHMSIRPDGKVNLCCNDALGQETLGDTTKETLLNIWKNQNYTAVRQNMIKNRNSHLLCAKCDTIIIPLDLRIVKGNKI